MHGNYQGGVAANAGSAQTSGFVSGLLKKMLCFCFLLLMILVFSLGTNLKANALTVEEFVFEVTVTNSGDSFYIPTSGNTNPAPGATYEMFNKSYNWNIDWGDNSSGNYTELTTSDRTPPSANGWSGASGINDGIQHVYNNAGTYTITITPNGSTDAWFSVFGFYSQTNPNVPSHEQSNRDMITAIISEFTPLMMRTQASLAAGTAAPYAEWSMTFDKCSNLTTTGPGFSSDYDAITIVNEYFCSNMFSHCASLTMSDTFNLPQGITQVSDLAFYSMFDGCSSDAFTMNDIFNLPQGITQVAYGFAGSMFDGCSGDAFTMNEVFNLPQGVTQADGSNCLIYMFSGCSGDAFTMNEVFNLPQGITQVYDDFAACMFSNCNGPAFQVNSLFRFPRLSQTMLDASGIFWETFQGVGPQQRSAVSIINNPAAPQASSPTLFPAVQRQTFDAAFHDIAVIHSNWGGSDATPDATITYHYNGYVGVLFPTETQGAQDTQLPAAQGDRIGTPVLQMAPGWTFGGWFKDSACTTRWDFDTETVSGATLSLYALAYTPVVFTDSSAFDIPAGQVGTAIVPVLGIAANVSGGKLPYTFSDTGLPQGLTIDPQTGVISGTPTAATAAGQAKIIVTTDAGQTDFITIDFGAIASVSNVSYDVLRHFGTWTGAGTVFARIDADNTKFVELKEGSLVLVAGTDYVVAAGSTVITLSETYLQTLVNGSHTYTAYFTDGSASPITLVVDAQGGGGSGGGGGVGGVGRA